MSLGLARHAAAAAEPAKLLDKTNNPHFQDPDLAALRDYAQQVGAQQPSIADSAKAAPPQLEDAELAALHEHVRQVAAEHPKLASAKESGSPHDHFADPALAELRDYARQIEADQQPSAGTPPLILAEAESAFDALRELFGKGAQPDQPPNSSPKSTPKQAPRAAPRPARPAAPRYDPLIINSHLIGTRTCLMCHGPQAGLYGRTLMGRISRTQLGKLECETCHGPGSAHVAAVGCAACHGEGGISRTPGTPSLVGQYPEYLVPAMRAYVNGERHNELKKLIMAGIGEAEAHAIASYYARQAALRTPTPLVGDPSAGRRASGPCADCHGEKGIAIAPAWPNLAGQDAQYLADSIRAYKHGSRSKVIACAACHGAGGVSNRPGMPSLVGQDPRYLVPAMRAYVTGERKHRLKSALFSGVSDSELESMAGFYAGQSPARAQTPLIGDPSAGKAASAMCEGCHGERGVPVDPAWPSLAGQDAQYFADAIEGYKNGSRDKTVACASCHGERGISKRPGMPSLVGLDPQYLVVAMKGYTNGQRKHALKEALFAGVSDTELNNMAQHYAHQTPARAPTASVGDPAAGKAASAVCAACHGEQGVSANPAWPSLAGQDARYLADATRAYKNGGSRTEATMQALVAALDDRTINDLAAYYASLRPAQPSVSGSAPSTGDPVLVRNGLVSSLDQRTIKDMASYFASQQPVQPSGGASARGGREPVLIRNGLIGSLDDRNVNNVASYYATLQPIQPYGAKIASAGPVPIRVGGARPADGSSVGGIISYRMDDPSRRVEDNNAICLNCHERGQRTYWRGSVHEERELACTSCHTVMRNVSPAALLKTAFEPNTCFQCHKDRQAQTFRSSHMPQREGKIVCSSCHNPHGSPYQGSGFAMLWTDSINDNCYKCHAEKRGPFLFEHAPVRENCTNCHDPHGSINEHSLKMSQPRLCYECHTIGHTQAGLASQFSVSRACLNCHTLIHGSNSPAGAVFQR
jgi:DmsE family decaheme c-type cytochrome